MRDPAAFADLVVMTVKSALATAIAPYQERIAALEAQIARFADTEKTLGDLRDRMVVQETKSAIVPAPVADPFVGELRERVAAIETKSVAPNHLDGALADVQRRLQILETKEPVSVAAPAEDTGLRDRVVAIETKAAELRSRIDAVDLTKDVSNLRERLAVVEVRAQIPGPPGKDGKDGADGLGFDDLGVEFDGDRTLAVKFERGDKVKSFPVTLPYFRYQGVYKDGQTYHEGDVVTWGGSSWHCKAQTTTKPGDAAAEWQLMVKRGRDGRDAEKR